MRSTLFINDLESYHFKPDVQKFVKRVTMHARKYYQVRGQELSNYVGLNDLKKAKFSAKYGSTSTESVAAW